MQVKPSIRAGTRALTQPKSAVARAGICTLIAVVSILVFVELTAAATPVRRINWREQPLPAEAKYHSADSTAPFGYLEVSSTGATPIEISLFTIDASCLDSPKFFVGGQVRWENSAGQAELILACEHADGSVTQNVDNRVRRGSFKRYTLNGSSDWGQYELGYCNCGDGKSAVKRFSLILRMPASGTFYFGPSQVYEGDYADLWQAQPGEWWGRGFSLLPLFIPVIIAGALVRRSASTRGPTKATWMVVGGVTTIGIAGLIAGIVALIDNQSFHVVIQCFTVGTLSCIGAYALPRTRAKIDCDSDEVIPRSNPVLQ